MILLFSKGKSGLGLIHDEFVQRFFLMMNICSAKPSGATHKAPELNLTVA